MSLQDDYFELTEQDTLSVGHKKAVNRIWNAFCDMEKEQEDLIDIQRSFKNIIRLCLKRELNSIDSEMGTQSSQIASLAKRLIKLEKANNCKKPKKSVKRKKAET
jgi:hypothetical protein